MKKIVIDPVTRIEGHLKIEATVDNGVIKEAKSSGSLLRGIELILKGRYPLDANQITQRICGVCPICHATASALAIDSALGIDDKIPDNGRILRNLILGSNFLQSHILHFYHLAALDYVDVTQVAKYDGTEELLMSLKKFVCGCDPAPFLPRYEGDYRFDDKTNMEFSMHYAKALEIRRKSHEMLAIFGGKAPHNCGIITGGVTIKPTIDKITDFLWRLNEIREFIDNIYLPDVLKVAKKYSDYFSIGAGCGNYLAYGGFDLEGKEKNLVNRKRLLMSGRVSKDLKRQPVEIEKITEDVKHSWYNDSTTGRNPKQGDTVPEMDKKEAYSFLKSPRYDGSVYEVGPLARILVNYVSGDRVVKEIVDKILGELKTGPVSLFSVAGRHAARAIESKIVADAMAGWVLELKPDEPVFQKFEIPDESEGVGLTEAPRGALGHWIKIKEKKIDNYQCVVPTTWNASPRDDKGQHGPIEQALIGTKIKDENNPFEIVRIVRSFDPCLACAVHLVSINGEVLNKIRTV
ncbi:MAG: nickel-dependent hydrogenase large subunit [Elusimicrobia bacterium CG_4_10_14_0_8_um_filter_37_32]|nr:MAG: nickel-dependent hydrogenase large subunit [Elusimicrobia bacterium CG02_land_8_20_14_3_00_37_13]PIZ12991.1 MAG: nickel-dependent hydrogenase large subunit [Elusimicrobia bacterium CG_4_10_14_0_8_um_filter_37_32]